MVNGADGKRVAAPRIPIRGVRSRAGVPELHEIGGIEKRRARCGYLVPVLVEGRDHLKFVDPEMFLIAHFFLGTSPQPMTALVLPPLSGPMVFFLLLHKIDFQYVSIVRDNRGGVCAPPHER